MTLPINHDEVYVQIENFNIHQIDDDRLQENSSCCCINHRNKRNFWRVSIAGGLSMAGGWLAGFLPTTAGIIGGAVLSGVGNGASTWLAWEQKNKKIIEARLMTDLPAFDAQINAFDNNLTQICERVVNVYKQNIATNKEDLNAVNELLTVEPKNMPCFWNGRMRRNFIRLFVAGGLSAVGGWIGGFYPTVAGTTVGGILGGIGNGLSTWLAFEKKNQRITEEDALQILPRLIEIMDENEKSLIGIINRIKDVRPEILMDFNQASAEEVEDDAEETSSCCSSRCGRNVTYVNIAGWLSGAGGAVAGFFPNAAGIISGGIMGGAANSISTWLAWENPNDREIDRRVLEDFPNLVTKVAVIYSKIHTLKEIMGDISSSYSDTSKED